MKAHELVQSMKNNRQPMVLDVRSGIEYRSGHIPGAFHIPLWKLLFRIARLPDDRTSKLVVTCEHGPRAQLAAGMLGSRGFRDVELLDGHMAAWRRAGHPLEK